MVWRCWGDGPPLVLLHGAFGSWLHWVRNIDGLARHFRVLATDMPGYGASAMPPEPYTAESLAEIMANGVRALLGDAPFHLAGFSLGGILGGIVAAKLGRQCETLILISPNGLALPFPPTAPMTRPTPEMSDAERDETIRQNLLVLMLAAPDSADALAVRIHLENARLARAKSGSIPGSDALLRALPNVTASIGAVYGTKDAFCGPYLDDRERILRGFRPHMDFRRIDGAGHWLPYERPREVEAAIVEMASA